MTDYNSLQKKRNMVVGSFVVIGIIVFIWLIFIFGELPLFITKHKSFYIFAQFPNAPGIQKNTPIRYCGYQIGKVFKVDPPDRLVHLETGETINQVKIGLALETKYEHKIPDNSLVRVMKRSMGSSYIEIIDVPDKPTGFLNSGTTTLQGDIGSTHEFIPKEFQQKVDSIADQICTLATDLNKIVGDEENRRNVKLALANFVKATEQADETFKSIQAFSDRGQSAMDDTFQLMQDFSDKGQNAMDDVSEQLSETLKELRVTLTAINEGGGTAGKLINDPTLYDNLLNASQELQLAVAQLKHLAADAREKGIKIAF